MIPRSFSLARLLLFLTAVCLYSGWMVNDPETSMVFSLAFVVWLVMVKFSRWRVLLTLVMVCGAIGGSILFAPPSMHSFGAPSYAEEIFIMLIYTSVPTAICAAVGGGAVLTFERHSRQANPTAEERLDQQNEINRLLRH